MTNTANQLVPRQRRFRRALAAVFSWLQPMEYTSFDYTLDRLERLEREVGQLKEQLRQSRDAGPVDAHNGGVGARTLTVPGSRFVPRASRTRGLSQSFWIYAPQPTPLEPIATAPLIQGLIVSVEPVAWGIG